MGAPPRGGEICGFFILFSNLLSLFGAHNLLTPVGTGGLNEDVSKALRLPQFEGSFFSFGMARAIGIVK